MINKKSIKKELIASLDFDKIHKIMKTLNWNWIPDNKIPTHSKLVLQAEELIDEVLDALENGKEEYVVATGGFEVIGSKKENYISIRFIAEEWNVYDLF